ncbi:MAG: LamG-like jellyroll fold domain-containing protein [Candidatus Paceibacterota bacterium]|jgi:hypothetical protein
MSIRPLTGQTLYSGNGAVVPGSNGAKGRAYTGFRSSWNGNLFSPPPSSGCVLNLSGHPGVGTVISDLSYNFSDSGIDTDEALDAGELAIDCDADATVPIPVGSIIRIGTELRKVTATGTTLTTVLYGASETHDTNQDIFVWIPNNGTITGALWKRLPSGLWYISYDGDDFITVTDAPNLSFGDGSTDSAFSCHCWAYLPSADAGALFSKATAATTGEYYALLTGGTLYWRIVDQSAVAYIGRSVAMAAYLNKWICIDLIYGGGALVANVKIYINGTQVDTTDSSSGTHVAMENTGVDLFFGKRGGGALANGTFSALKSINSGENSITKIANTYNQERHLFGV